jgi:cellulose synthase/poly-beta-1,6-N-acetylglucosamine synthase-like glycosyltransferase
MVNMINIAGTIIFVLALFVYVQVLFLLAQVLASLPSKCATDRTHGRQRRPSVCVIVPAHNESALIAEMIMATKSQLTTTDRMVVVADNCSDDTARRSALAGAEVIERHDPEHVGKGYALDYGIKFLQQTKHPEVVVFVDADCELAPGSIDELAQLSFADHRPVQATNLMEGPRMAGRTARIAQFAWRMKNYVRPLGASRLRLPCQLTGTGMAIPWSLLSSVELSTGHIAEDAKLGIDLAISGYGARFCPGAMVTSRFPISKQGIRVQRTRWEHGHLALICEYVPYLLWNACKKRRISLLAVALDWSIPPLGLFVLIMVTLAGGATLVMLGGFSAWPVIITGSAILTFGLTIGFAWHRHGRTIVSARDLLSAPVYALSKIPMFWRFITKRQDVWIRAERDHD